MSHVCTIHDYNISYKYYIVLSTDADKEDDEQDEKDIAGSYIVIVI